MLLAGITPFSDLAGLITGITPFSDVADEEEGNDWLYTVVADIIAAHNAFIEGVYSSVQAQRQAPLARLLPDEPAKVYPSEVNDSSCIVGKFRR